MREGRSHYLQLFLYLWLLKREGMVLFTSEGRWEVRGQIICCEAGHYEDNGSVDPGGEGVQLFLH